MRISIRITASPDFVTRESQPVQLLPRQISFPFWNAVNPLQTSRQPLTPFATPLSPALVGLQVFSGPSGTANPEGPEL
jgi:hypothetical protein